MLYLPIAETCTQELQVRALEVTRASPVPGIRARAAHDVGQLSVVANTLVRRDVGGNAEPRCLHGRPETP